MILKAYNLVHNWKFQQHYSLIYTNALKETNFQNDTLVLVWGEHVAYQQY